METVTGGDEIFHDRVIPIIRRIFKGSRGHIGVNYRREPGDAHWRRRMQICNQPAWCLLWASSNLIIGIDSRICFKGRAGPAEGLAILHDPLYILLAKYHGFREAVTERFMYGLKRDWGETPRPTHQLIYNYFKGNIYMFRKVSLNNFGGNARWQDKRIRSC